MSSMEESYSPQIVITNRKGHTNVGDIESQKLVEELREFYLDARKTGRGDQMQIFRDFRKSKEFEGIWFNPYRNQLLSYFKRWEQSLPFHVKKIPIKVKDTKRMPEKEQLLKEVAYHDLEAGSKNLQQMLIEDATDLLTESKQQYQAIDEGGGIWGKTDYEKIRIAKKKLALSISKEVLAGAHKFQLIALKKNAEGRQNVGFLMDLVRRSQAGEVSSGEMNVLEGAIMQ